MATASTTYWADRPVLVTGASGLLGGHLVARLVALGAAVVCLARDARPPGSRRVEVVAGDARDQELLTRTIVKREIATTFHLAAQAIVGAAGADPSTSLDANVRGTWSALEACRRGGSEVVVASSDKAYGDHGGVPYTEDMPLRGRHPYDASKACADMIAQSYAWTYKLPVAITRCGNLYGGGDRHWSRLVPGTIRAAIRGRRPVVRSDGTCVRDYLYAPDAAEGYLLAAEAIGRGAEPGRAYNLAGGRPLSVLEMVAMIAREVGAGGLSPEVLGGAAAEIPMQRLDCSRAEAELGWRASTTIEAGLAATVAWYRRHLRPRAER